MEGAETNNLKILFLIDSFRRGGKERRLLELLRYLENRSDIESEVVLFKNKIDYPQVNELKRIKLIILDRKFKKDPFVLFKIIRHCKRFKPDMIHSWGSMPSVYGVPVARFFRISLINGMVVKASCPAFSKDWIRSKLTFPFSRIILSNSEAGLKSFRAPVKRSKVIYNGFNYDRLNDLGHEKEIKDKFGIKTNHTVGMVAAIQPRKDFHTYLKVAVKMCSQRNDITFLVVGDGPERENLASEFKHENIIFTGNLDKVEQIVSVLDFGVLLTNHNKHLEGISNSILEMMALGKPVIASSGGGTNEIVLPKRTGILITPQSDSELENAISLLLEDKEKLKKLGLGAEKLVKEVFSIDKMCTSMIDLYYAIKNGGRAG